MNNISLHEHGGAAMSKTRILTTGITMQATASREELYSKPFLSVKEFALVMDYHWKTVERQIKAGGIPTVSIGTSSIRIDFNKFKKQGGSK